MSWTLPAYGLRWLIEYKDINEILTQVKIYEADYSGDSTDVTAQSDPVTIRWGDDSSDDAPIIYGSTATISFFADSDYQFIDLFTADPEKYLVEIYKNGSLFWKGYVIADQWNEPLTTIPYPVSVECCDRLSDLRNEDFVDDDGAAYSGYLSLKTILASILDKTHMVFPFNTSIDYHEISQDPATDTLSQTDIDVSVYEGKTCAEVLESLFIECRIYQRSGSWWVISNSNYQRTSLTCNQYSSSGVYITQASILNAATGWQMEGEPSLEMKPALKYVKINQIYGLKDNLIENPNFEESGGSVSGWSYIGNAPEVKTLDDDGNKYIYQAGREHPTSSENMNNCIYQTFRVKATSKNIRLKFRYCACGKEDEYCYMFWKLAVVSDTGTNYYAARIEGPTTETTKWKFVTASSNELENRSVKYTYDYRFSNVQKIRAWLEENVPDNFGQFEAIIEGGFPVDGNLSLVLYVPYNGNDDVYGSCWTEISLEYLTADETILPTNTNYKIIRDSRNNKVPDDIEIPHGDLPPAIENAGQAYIGGFNSVLGVLTTAWKKDGDSISYTYVELLGRLIAARMRRAQQSYRMTINGITPNTAMVLVDPYNGNRKFLENGITYNDRLGTIEGQWIEQIATDLATGISVETEEERETENVVNTISSGGGSNNTTPTAPTIDEKVALADEDTGEVTGEAGTLADGYFEKKTISGIDNPVYIPKDIKVNGVQFTGILQGTYSKLSGALQKIDGLQAVQGISGAQGIQGISGSAGSSFYGTSTNYNYPQAVGETFNWTTQSGLAYKVGDIVQISYSDTEWMICRVTAYNGTTLSTVVLAQSGTFYHSTWTIDLAGRPGIQGATGIQGTFGLQGANGIQGTTGIGSQGTQGIQGRQGTSGIQGSTGVQGATGLQGTGGIQGSAGVQGAIGLQGVTGIQGTTGIGIQGTQGIQGRQGTTGIQGADGLGTQGTQGIQGPGILSEGSDFFSGLVNSGSSTEFSVSLFSGTANTGYTIYARIDVSLDAGAGVHSTRSGYLTAYFRYTGDIIYNNFQEIARYYYSGNYTITPEAVDAGDHIEVRVRFSNLATTTNYHYKIAITYFHKAE